MSTKNEAYLCLSAMVAARAPKLLTNEKAERMLDAPTFEDAAKLLTDCGYPDMSQMNASDVEACLAQHRDAIFAELGRYSPDSRLVDVFKLKYDYHNAKVIIKAEAKATSIWVLRPALFSLFSLSQPMSMPQRVATITLAIRSNIISFVNVNSCIKGLPGYKLFPSVKRENNQFVGQGYLF